MKAFRNKETINQEWQNFLRNTNGFLRLSRHCRKRLAERFPELQYLPASDILTLVRASKPLYTFIMADTKHEGIVVRNGKVTFAISFNTRKVITTFRYKRNRAKKIRINIQNKGASWKKKSVYYRPRTKNNFRRELAEVI